MAQKHESRAAAMLAPLFVLAAVAGAQDYEMSRFTIDGGGALSSDGGEYNLSGTVGQPDVGSMASGGFELTGGFWLESPPSDCNNTGGVDLLDYDDFEDCLTGPGASVIEECECFDVNRSGTIDLLDFAVAQAAFVR